jgi:hypothetical protein
MRSPVGGRIILHHLVTGIDDTAPAAVPRCGLLELGDHRGAAGESIPAAGPSPIVGPARDQRGNQRVQRQRMKL